MTMSITKLHFRQLRLNTTDFVEDTVTNHGEILLKDGAVTRAKIRDGAVTTNKIAADAVTHDKIATGAVINSKIGSSAVTTDKIADGNITTAKINNLAITADKLAEDAVTTVKILDGAVTTDKIADSTGAADGVTTDKIATGAVTSAKIADNNVISSKIGAGQVLNANIAADTIEIDRFANLATQDEDKLFIGEQTQGDVQLGFLESRHFNPNEDYANIRKIGAQAQDIEMSGNRVTGMKDPINAQDGATKAYVDGVSDSLYWKAPVVARSTAAAALASAFEAGDSLDGVPLSAGDRILLMDQPAASGENGIYIVQASGAPQRASDADEFDELNGAAVFVLGGSTHADKGYVQTAELSALSDDQTWVQFSGLGQYSAGTGINIDPSTGVISISSIQLAQIDIKREAPALLEGITNAVELQLGAVDAAPQIGGQDIGSVFNAGMSDSSAQLYLNGTLIRKASAKNTIGTDGDYFIDEVQAGDQDRSGAAKTAGNANLRVDSSLVQEGDRLELRYYNA